MGTAIQETMEEGIEKEIGVEMEEGNEKKMDTEMDEGIAKKMDTEIEEGIKKKMSTEMETKMEKDKAIITVVGKDRIGITAGVCTYLADSGINILDIRQTILSGFFSMMMIVDLAAAEKDFSVIVEELNTLGEKIGVSIKCQREDIFEKMHRI